MLQATAFLIIKCEFIFWYTLCFYKWKYKRNLRLFKFILWLTFSQLYFYRSLFCNKAALHLVSSLSKAFSWANQPAWHVSFLLEKVIGFTPISCCSSTTQNYLILPLCFFAISWSFCKSVWLLPADSLIMGLHLHLSYNL